MTYLQLLEATGELDRAFRSGKLVCNDAHRSAAVAVVVISIVVK